MALKKSELYSSLWSSCDELRGGMDASQYKDYVLVLLFVKYVSDKFAGQFYAPIKIPAGASFADMVALKGKTDIGDQINKKILGPLARENNLSDMPDFNDPNKLGSGKEMVDRLTNLIAIFENPALDFSKNRADGDDLLGDAYEYLMRHFATESGKSKGQFYTPSEVSRVIAQILGIRHAATTNKTTAYDPTCGSGSLLLKVGDEAGRGKNVRVTLYGQEKDSSTAGLARMNMILHDYATAQIKQGNTLANPLFKDGDALKTFDYVVANIPFSDKRWSTGLHPNEGGKSAGGGEQSARDYGRFAGYGIPPAKQGDYAYLLHILRSIAPEGKGTCILPHGVLFRGNAEGLIRKNLVQRGVVKAIIGLPANLFYGTLGKKKYQAELIPPALVITRYHAAAQAKIETLEAQIAALQQQLEEMAEEQAGEGGPLEDAKNDTDKLTKASVAARLKEIKTDPDAADERKVLNDYLRLSDQETDTSAKLKAAQDALIEKVATKYGQLTEDEIKTLVVDDKWLASIKAAVQGELDRVSQTLTGRTCMPRFPSSNIPQTRTWTTLLAPTRI